MRNLIRIQLLGILILGGYCLAQSSFEMDFGADLMSRYVWRGLDIGNSPAIQPTISLSRGGFEAGVWGSYALNDTASDTDEIDLWLSYGFELKHVDISLLVTDYYFPNAGLPFGNYNDYDDENGPGAHVLEAGASFGVKDIPLTFSAYYNFHNDAGNNAYFQLDYDVKIQDQECTLFCGATTGSDENPDYYGAEDFSIINLGIQANKNLKFTENFSLPITIALSYNPEAEQTFLVFGMTF